MKFILFALLAVPAQAGPYFRLLKPLDEVKTGAFVKIGTPNDNVAYGLQTTLVKHRAEDGYLLVEGVGWNLLDVGYAKPETGRNGSVILGPSIDISEPIKVLLLRGLNHLYPNSFGSVRALLQPTGAGKPSVAASIGPGLSIDPGDLKDYRTVKGSLVIHAGLQAKF